MSTLNLPLAHATPIDSVKQEIMDVFGIGTTIGQFQAMNDEAIQEKFPKAKKFLIETVRDAVNAFLSKVSGKEPEIGR